ncbi:MAG: hypothetical protein LBL21_01220 [Rickettsiales bacterium]|jgi:hypothetical protein|nr:hypothetical protein [Rickettsiales bacterium]
MFWSIKNLESKLLSQSTEDDIVVVLDKQDAVESPQTLNPEQIKKEVSVLARILINGYCGWPFHSKLLKWSVLSKLNKMFDANVPMPVTDFFDRIGAILEKIPDNHLNIQSGRKWSNQNKKKIADVGKNIAGKSDYKIETRDGFAIIAVPSLGAKSGWMENPERFIDDAKSAVDNAHAAIIDLRGNSGGNSHPLDLLAEHLYGARTPWCENAYIRGTPEGAVFRGRGVDHFNKSYDMSGVDLSKDPCLWITAENIPYPKFCGVTKPIYILTDGRVASSGELFLTLMSHHPFAKRVGANTRGCEIYGYISRAVLPYSGIIIKVGNVYRELEAGNIEMKGYAPDIRVPDGEDALGAAKSDFYNRGKGLAMRGGRTK